MNHISTMQPRSFVLAFALTAAGCSSNHELLQSRAAEWRSNLNQAVPSGTAMQDAKAWAERKGISLQYIETRRQLYGIAERVPETGINKLVCSEWAVILKISFSDSGVSESNEVSTIGACL